MSSTTTQTTIANRGLQILGYKPIGSLSDNDRGARAMNRAYQPVLLSTLRSNFWSFAIKRAILAASTTQPIFGPANYFPVPGDFVMLAPPDQNSPYVFGSQPGRWCPGEMYNDWKLENNNGIYSIISDDVGPLKIRFVSSNITEANFDPSFSEMFSANLAMETCEELTQSNTKKADIENVLKVANDIAKKRNAFETKPVRPPVDPWILSRM